jgi:hypothetical protein
MNRRRFLEVAAGSSAFVAGCSRGGAPTRSAGDERTIFVGPDGSRGNPGTREAPLASIQEGLERAQPGERVHVLDGEYREFVETVRSGRPDAPITITGSTDAVLRGVSETVVVFIVRHSHIHLRGLTVTGLHDPSRPDDPESYVRTVYHALPPFDTDEYLEDLVVAPTGIGNSYRALMLFNRVNGLEIGPTEIVGLAGAVYVLGDAEDHTGEIIYLGTPPDISLKVDVRPGYPWDGLDETRHVHVHHVDNSAGHPHSELVNTKLGTRDVLVEYCTSLGGSQNTEPYSTAEIRFQSHEATLRWSEIRNGEGFGVQVVPHRKLLDEHPDAAMTPEQAGANHAIYGNVITGFGRKPFSILPGRDVQRVICGNSIPAATRGSDLRVCPTDLPAGNGIGHQHILRSEYQWFSEVILQFSRTLSPEERGDPSSGMYIALRVHKFELLDDDDGVLLDVDVGAEDDADAVVWGDGVYGRIQKEGHTWRFIGGEDMTANLFITDQRLQRASRLRLQGTAVADDIDMGVSLGGAVVDEVALVPNENRWYTLSLDVE